MVKEIDYDLLIAIEESDVRKFQIALEKRSQYQWYCK